MFRNSIGLQRVLNLSLFATTYLYTGAAWAVCDSFNPGSNTSIACSGNNSDVIVNALTGSTNVTLMVQAGASLTAQHVSPVSLAILSVEMNSSIENMGALGLTNSGGTGTHRGAVILANGEGNQLFNRQGATIITSGDYNDGMTANGSSNTLLNEGYVETNGPNSYGMSAAWGQSNSGQINNTLINLGEIVTNGSHARGISILGQSSLINNQGIVITSGNNSPAIYMQGDNDRLINSGHVEVSGVDSDAVFSNTVGSSFSATIENQAGGLITSQQGIGIRSLNGSTTVINAGLIHGAVTAIGMGNGDDRLILQTGSVIEGIADGGAGTNHLFLQGSGTVSNPFTNFQSLDMQGNHWIWVGAGAFDQVRVSSGQLQLAGTLQGTTSLVSSGAVLSGEGVLVGDLLNQGLLQPGTGSANGQLVIQGNYQGDQGMLLFNSVLGDDSSPTSRLVIDGGNVTGTTTVEVINLNGRGAQTTADGILLVQAINGASTDITAFSLGGRVVAGAYEYDLYRGGFDGSTSDNNWYLRSINIPLIPEPVRIQGPIQKPSPRPEAGVYLRNLTAASNMFMHTLHDRLGEPQFTGAYKADSNVPSVWMRVVGNRTKGQAADGLISMDTDSTLVQFGGDLARWSNNNHNRMHFGLMGAYGQSDTDADAKQLYTNNGIKRTANGKVDGYSVGTYITWYGNSDQASGPYIDTWAQYAWYDNKVKGNALKEERYDSAGWIISAEGGYAFVAGNSETRLWMIEPQVQVAYNNYSADDHKEVNGTRVRNGDTDGVIARIGTRLYTRGKQNDNAIQPFIEANWRYSSQKNSLTFNDVDLNDDSLITPMS